MKRIFFIPIFLFGSEILSNLDKTSLNLQEKKVIAESKITKYSWINPITVKYTISKDNSLGVEAFTKTFSISLTQPIFKSGAIYYSIKYGDDLKNLNLENIEINRRKLIKNAYELALDYKITLLNKKILKLKIDNSLIDVKRKREEYLNGTLDSTFLNNAIISLNSLKLSLEDLNQQLADIEYSFKNISDMDIKKVNLNIFKIISLNEYLSNNIELQAKQLAKKINQDLYKIEIGNSLFTVFVNGSWNYQTINYSSDFYKDDKKNFYSLGAGVSLALDINSKRKVEKAKLNYLISNYDFLKEKRVLINEYKKVISKLELISRKIKIYKNNIELYDELITSTKNNINAGSATIDDLKILENSKFINYIQIKILNLESQKLLLELYYNLTKFSN